MKGQKAFVQKRATVKLKFDVPGAVNVTWYQIIPDTSQYFQNADMPWEKNAYQWTGFAKIKYQLVEIPKFRNKKIVVIDTDILEENRPLGRNYYRSEVGSFWFQAIGKTKSGKIIKSLGIEKNDYRGISPTVFRLSCLDGKDYVGRLSSFFNVPGVFGSTTFM